MSNEEVKSGNYVQVHYTGTFSNGEVFDSSEGKQPLEVLAGKGMLIKGFDDALIGMKPGEEKEINVPSAEAYGEHRPELIREIQRSELGDDIDPEVGMMLGIRAPTGQVFPATITEVHADNIKLDANHPLAGKDLHFKIKVEATREPTEQDMQQFTHGHDHDHDEHGCCGGGCGSDESCSTEKTGCGNPNCDGNCSCGKKKGGCGPNCGC